MTDSSHRMPDESSQPDAKRRKTEPDRARISYLCAQLRTRLQYARLKVEHGWQRQSLNEVENLYFRHAQKSRPAPPPSTRRTQPQQQHLHRVNFHTISSASPNGSSSIFPVAIHQFEAPLAPSPLVNTNSGSALTLSNSEARSSSVSHEPLSADTGPMNNSGVNAVIPLTADQAVTRSVRPTPSVGTSPPSSSGPCGLQEPASAQKSSQSSGSAQSGFSTFPATNSFTFSVAQSQRPNQNYSQDPLSPSRDLSQPTVNRAVNPSTPSTSSNQISDALESLSTSGLTYDSFWSSHTSYHTGGFGHAFTIPPPSQNVGQAAQTVAAGAQSQ